MGSNGNMFGFPGVPSLIDDPSLRDAAAVIKRAREHGAASAGQVPIQASEVTFTWQGGKNDVPAGEDPHPGTAVVKQPRPVDTKSVRVAGE